MARPPRGVGQMLLTAHDFERENAKNNILSTLGVLPRDIVTIINENDTVATDELNLGDNDQLAARIATLVKAEILILLTDIDGVFNKDPRKHEDATIKRVLSFDELTEEFIESCGGGTSTNGTGGMASKLRAARIASADNIQTFIANGKRPGVLSAIVREEQVGTEIRPRLAA